MNPHFEQCYPFYKQYFNLSLTIESFIIRYGGQWTNWIIGSTDNPARHENVFETININAASKSNLNDKIHFHSLRHSFASLLAQKGVSLYIIKELLGHEDLATTQIYSHLQQQNLRDAVKVL